MNKSKLDKNNQEQPLVNGKNLNTISGEDL